jgi:hypothetical protein
MVPTSWSPLPPEPTFPGFGDDGPFDLPGPTTDPGPDFPFPGPEPDPGPVIPFPGGVGVPGLPGIELPLPLQNADEGDEGEGDEGNGEEGGGEGEDGAIPPSAFPPDFDDPEQGPEDWPWHGPDDPGGPRGGYVNPDDGDESWHPDLDNEEEGPHWDHNHRRGDPTKTRYGPGWGAL